MEWFSFSLWLCCLVSFFFSLGVKKTTYCTHSIDNKHVFFYCYEWHANDQDFSNGSSCASPMNSRRRKSPIESMQESITNKVL